MADEALGKVSDLGGGRKKFCSRPRQIQGITMQKRINFVKRRFRQR